MLVLEHLVHKVLHFVVDLQQLEPHIILQHQISFEFPEEGWIPREAMMMTTVSFEHGLTEEGAPRSNVNLVITDLGAAPIDVKSLDDFTEVVREQLSMAVDSLQFLHQKVSSTC